MEATDVVFLAVDAAVRPKRLEFEHKDACTSSASDGEWHGNLAGIMEQKRLQ